MGSTPENEIQMVTKNWQLYILTVDKFKIFTKQVDRYHKSRSIGACC